MDADGPYKWPDETEEIKLLVWLKNLTMMSWTEIRQYQRSTGQAAVKKCDIEQITPDAIQRLNELYENNKEFSNIDPAWLYEFTYCLKEGDSRRLWCFQSEDSFYVLWWDQHHQVSGVGGSWDVSGRPCEAYCWHPKTTTYSK